MLRRSARATRLRSTPAPQLFILRSRPSASRRMDRVLVPTWTFTATAEVVRYLGAHPVFVYADPATLNIDVAKLEQRIVELKQEYGDKVKAVMPVHIGGQACEMDKIVALAVLHRLAIVEDAAHAFPTTVRSASITGGGASRAWSAR